MTCSDLVNLLKMFICSEKHPVSGANYGYAKIVVIDRWPTIETLSAAIFLHILIYSTILSPTIRFIG